MRAANYYDTGKVKIGLHYRPDVRPELSASDELIQSAFIGKPGNIIEQFIDDHPRLSPYVIFAVLIAAMGLASSIS